MKVPAAELERLATSALRAGGLDGDGATRGAHVLVLADLFGIHTHGVQRIPQYLARVRLGGVDPRPAITVERLAPALVRVDGAGGLGPVVGSHALEMALAAVRETGVAAAFVRGSNHFGPVMPYLYDATRQGCAAVVASNATTTIAPWGGREAKLGNNPLGIGVPNPAGDPVLLDMAMSTVARAKIRAAARSGVAIPASWATDASGRPTTDPQVALDGFLQPFGGHKGYGLALLVDLLAGVLSGAGYLTGVSSWDVDPGRPQDLGHVFVLVDTARLGSAGWLGARVAEFAEIVHDTEPVEPATPVRLPGEAELAAYHRQLADGVEIAADDLAALSELANGRQP